MERGFLAAFRIRLLRSRRLNCSFCLILFCFWPILLASFSLNPHFPKGRLFCAALGFFSSAIKKLWHWYIFNLRLLLSILFFSFFLCGIEMPDRNGLWYQHLLTFIICLFFYKSNTERANFQIRLYNMFICLHGWFYVCKMCMFCIVFNFSNISISKKPRGDHVRMTGL